MDLEKDKAGRNRLQNYVLLPLYLTLSLWQELMDPAYSFEFALASLSSHCVLLGLKFPSESTCGMVYTLLNYKTPQKFKEPSILYQDYVHVKNCFKDSLLRSRTSLQLIPGQYLLELPRVWQDLPIDMLDKVFGNEPPCETKGHFEIFAITTTKHPFETISSIGGYKDDRTASRSGMAFQYHVCSFQNEWWPRTIHIGVCRWTPRKPCL